MTEAQRNAAAPAPVPTANAPEARERQIDAVLNGSRAALKRAAGAAREVRPIQNDSTTASIACPMLGVTSGGCRIAHRPDRSHASSPGEHIMEGGSGRKAVIVGGSVGGLFAATALRASGWRVDVFEQSPHELDSRGGGIVLQPPIERAFAFGGVALPRDAGVDSIDRIYVDAQDRIVQRFAMPQTQTGWNVIYTALKRALPDGIVHAGDAFERFEQAGERIVAHFSSGRVETADLLIGADGGRSTVRAQLLPAVRPSYAGYVAWRGLVDESALPEQVLYLLRERFTFQQGGAHQFLTYLVPGANGATGSGRRRVNWVWYRRLADDRLPSLFLTRDGTQRDGSLPPGAMRDDNRAELVAAGNRMLAPTLATLVEATPAPFAQAIQDLSVERMAFGRAVLLGDAACLVRPHTAAGVAKAADNAVGLAEALRDAAHGTAFDAALAGWDARQRAASAALSARRRGSRRTLTLSGRGNRRAEGEGEQCNRNPLAIRDDTPGNDSTGTHRRCVPGLPPDRDRNPDARRFLCCYAVRHPIDAAPIPRDSTPCKALQSRAGHGRPPTESHGASPCCERSPSFVSLPTRRCSWQPAQAMRC
ncbi:MAG: FAD binding domain-containing protein [Burkholderia sp.]|nr:FAD binding domain-containing protein [Burkholderia sp.]